MKNIIRSDLQVLITGCYRSGTDYSSVILNNHPNFVVTTYTTSFMRYSYNQYNPINKKENYVNLLNEAKKRIKDRWNKNLDIKKIITHCKKEKKVTYGLLYDLMMGNLFLNESIKKWGEKTQLAWRQIPDFFRLFPNGKAINIIRDPRSVLASFKKSTYNPEPAYLGAVFNCFDSMQKSHYYSKKYKSKFLHFRYEDIALKPKKTLKKIYKFLNLKSDHDLLNEKKWLNADGSKFIHNSVFASKKEKKDDFDFKASIKRWKNHLSSSEIAFCEFINKEVMKLYNYKISNKDRDWSSLLSIIFKDKKILRYFKKWLLKNEGIQEFPNNPLDRRNWEENKLKSFKTEKKKK